MVQRKREYKATSKAVTNLALLNMDIMDGCPAPGPFVFDDFPLFDFLAESNEQRKKQVHFFQIQNNIQFKPTWSSVGQNYVSKNSPLSSLMISTSLDEVPGSQRLSLTEHFLS